MNIDLDLFSNLLSTENLSIWGAISGTIGTLIGTFSFIIRYKTYHRDKSKIKVESHLKYQKLDNNDNHLIIFYQGKQPIYIGEIKYYLRPPGIRYYIRFYYYNKHLYICNRNINTDNMLEPNRKIKINIHLFEGMDLSEITKIRVIDETGKEWKVPWYTKKIIKHYNSNQIIRDEETFKNDTHEIKIICYYIGDYYKISMMYQSHQLRESKGRSFHFLDESQYNKALSYLIDNIISKILNGEITDFGKIDLNKERF